MTTSNPLYFRGQGKLKIAFRDENGNITGYRQVGNVPTLKLDPKVTWIEHRESMTGLRSIDLMLPDTQSLGVTFELEVADSYNMQMALYGSSDSFDATSGSTAINAVLPTDAEAGLDYVFGPAGATVTSVTDDDGTALVAGTHYRANTDGTVSLLNITGFVAPLVVVGAKVSFTSTDILNQSSQEVSVIFEGLNTANSRKPVVIRIPRLRLNPAKSVSVIGTELVKFELEGQALMEPNAIALGVLGGYGKIELVA